ncbi:putative amidohydrolase [Spinactinospora alkalitolerans]|uniref:Putative amidohydrolase n=1 Tax=Spinactinospora alkalitolerans TaxID=687207 RepID=A0A852TZU3_9ACTN|nr:carbon-nitrogen hydrolase family protein [Spinactinospora alkalitolerans]NYE50096.1 putative amidohydrolase [Spinactinospora alkalitolerans]
MLASVAQFAAATDKSANLGTVSALIQRAAASGNELVVLPENAMWSDPGHAADITTAAEPLDGPFTVAVEKSAREFGITVVVGMSEASHHDSGKPTNTVIAVGSDGTRLGVYRKVHLYDAFGYRESDRIEARAPQALTFTLGGITFGVMTCYDIRFPEMARFLVDAGAQALILPAAWAVGPAKEDHWMTLARARAIENTVYVLASGQTGPACTGQSTIIDPMGHLAASAGEAPGIASAVLDPSRLETVRAKNPSLANRKFAVTGMGLSATREY